MFPSISRNGIMYYQIACGFLLAFTLVTGIDAADPLSETEIAQAVEQLGDPSFRVREAATTTLWKAGNRARGALEAAARSDDPETAHRASGVLEKVRMGILPDTPAEVVKLIEQYQKGSASARRSIAQKLCRDGRTQTAIALVRSEVDESRRKSLLVAIAPYMKKLVASSIAERDFNEVEQLLQMWAMAGNTKDYAVFLAIQGKIDETIERLEKTPADKAAPTDQLMLITLYRIVGNFDAAIAVAEQTKISSESTRRYTIESLLGAQHNWSALAERRTKTATASTRSPSIDQLSIDAAYFHLGKRPQEFADAVEKLQQRADQNPKEAWFCAEALLICSRQTDAIELLKKHSPQKAFELLVARGEYQQAFQLVGVDLPLGDREIEIVLPKKASESPAALAKRTYYYKMAVARVLSKVGENQRSLKLFKQMSEMPEGRPPATRLTLAKEMLAAGFESEAFALAAPLIRMKRLPSVGDDVVPYDPSRAFRTLFASRGATAAACWEHLHRMHPEESSQQLLKRLRPIVSPTYADLVEDTQFQQLKSHVDKVLTSATEKVDDSSERAALRALGELCELRGKKEAARNYYERLANSSKSGADRLKVADLLAADKQWDKAAKWYKDAHDLGYQATLTMFLQGWALKKSGDAKKADELMHVARMLPLADPGKRYELFNGLDKRGLRSLAAAERRIVARLGSIRDWHANTAAKELGNDLSKSDPLRAAEHWQRSALSVLRTNSGFLESTAYLRLPHVIHKVRARGLLASGKDKDAQREIWFAHQAMPAEIDLALDLVPLLRKAKLDTIAEELFEKVYAVNQRSTEHFPESAHLHNVTSWLAARCERRLDEALEHAQAAVRLAPDRAAYLDTLAEVYFARGDQEKAVELSRRCVEMEPHRAIYKTQLQRFEQRTP